jgi:hypothetical protein
MLDVGGCGYSLQFAKASAATIRKHEKNDTADVKRASEYIWLYRYTGKLAQAAMDLRRDRVFSRGFAAGASPMAHVCIVCAFGEKNSAWASGGPAGLRHVAACLGQ